MMGWAAVERLESGTVLGTGIYEINLKIKKWMELN